MTAAVPGRRLSALLRVGVIPVLVIAAIVVAWKLGYFELDRRRHFVTTVQRVRDLPLTAPLFVVAYVVAVAACLPVSVLTLVGGALFGPLVGGVLSWGGAMTGTMVTHFLARTIARGAIRRLFGSHRLLDLLKRHDSVGTLFRLRVLPLAPFGVLDYAAGLANVSLRRLLYATAGGIIPTVVAYSYAGDQLFAGLVSDGEAARRGLWIAGAATLVMVLVSLGPALTSRLRR